MPHTTDKTTAQKLAEAGYVQIVTDTTTNPSQWLVDPNNLNQN